MKRTIIATFAMLILVAAVAGADDHGMGGSGMGSGMGGYGTGSGMGGSGTGGYGMGGYGMGGPGGGPSEMPLGTPLIVGSDGTIYVTHTVIDTSTRTSTTTLTAITPAGKAAWTATLTNAGRLTLSHGNLISVSDTHASDESVTSTLTALSAATGTTAWTRTITGQVFDLTPFNGGTYVIAVIPATTSGGTASRSLIALDNSGNILWTVSI